MGYDPERTKRAILDSAAYEFVTYGPAAARVARIAERAGVNKERLYGHFGAKDQLFEIVLMRELTRLAEALPLGEDEDLVDYTVRVHLYHRRNPRFLRLIAWEALEGRELVAREARSSHYRRRVDAVRRLQEGGTVRDDIDPARLLYGLFAVAAWSCHAPQILGMLTGEEYWKYANGAEPAGDEHGYGTPTGGDAQEWAVRAMAAALVTPGGPVPPLAPGP